MNSDKYVLQEVTSPALEREWLDLPKRIYKGNRNWVCPLDVDIREVFDPAKNDLFADGEAIRWVVRDASGEVRYAIGVVGMFRQVYSEDFLLATRLVCEAGSAISRAIGYRP